MPWRTLGEFLARSAGLGPGPVPRARPGHALTTGAELAAGGDAIRTYTVTTDGASIHLEASPQD